MKSKTKKLLAIGLSLALAAGCTMVLSACDPEEEPPVLTDEPLAGETVADFTQGESERFFSSDGWTNKSVFNTWWSADNVSYDFRRWSAASRRLHTIRGRPTTYRMKAA